MDRITHQSPRQRGYGSTSSHRNDSLKHTRKHKRRKGGIEPRNKALRLWRTVRPGGADRPHGPRGPSGLLPRTVRTHTPQTIRPCAADRPKKQTEPPETTPNNGTSAGSTRTVRQAPASSARYTRTVRNFAQRKLKATKDRNKRRARTRRTPDEQGRRGLSA
jgi:hypothetical protein